nr:RNA-directed DNA polymerase [Tanacetum cinerariifolium]
MINGYAQIGEVDNALECLRKLRGDGCVMSRFTVTGVLPVLTLKGDVWNGRGVHGLVAKIRYFSGVAVCNALVDMYCKCKCFSGVAVCNALVDMYSKCNCFFDAMHIFKGMGFGNKELDVFRKMCETDVTPDEVTFVGVLSACSHSGLVKKDIDVCSINNLVLRKVIDFLTLPMEICLIEGYQVCRVLVTIGKSYKVEVLCILDDIDECHILLGGPYRCEDWSSPKTLSEVRNDKVADALSRKTTLLVSISNEAIGFDSIKELYASDENFCITWMEFKTKQHRGEFLILDIDLLKGNRLCIPSTSFRRKLIKEVHAGGLSAHLGRDKTIVSVESQFYWPKLKKDVGAFVRRCFCVKKEWVKHKIQ